MLSLGCHGLLLFLPLVGQFGTVWHRPAPTLEIRLAPHGARPAAPQVLPALTALPPPAHTAAAITDTLQNPAPAPDELGTSSGLPAYLPSAALTEQPHPLADIDPSLPLPPGEAFAAEAVLEVLINAQGGVDRVRIVQSDLPEDAADVLLRRFLAIRFSPARQGEQAVACRIQVRLRLEAD